MSAVGTREWRATALGGAVACACCLYIDRVAARAVGGETADVRASAAGWAGGDGSGSGWVACTGALHRAVVGGGGARPGAAVLCALSACMGVCRGHSVFFFFRCVDASYRFTSELAACWVRLLFSSLCFSRPWASRHAVAGTHEVSVPRNTSVVGALIGGVSWPQRGRAGSWLGAFATLHVSRLMCCSRSIQEASPGLDAPCRVPLHRVCTTHTSRSRPGLPTHPARRW